MPSSHIPKRHIGKSGLSGSALGFGCMSLTPGFYGNTMDLAESEKVLRRALDLGITVLNTADFYGFGHRENISLIGKVLKDYPRDRAIITMKWGIWIEASKDGPVFSLDLSPQNCKKRIDEALKVLGTDYIDVLVLRLGHGPDPKAPLKETAQAMKDLVDSGKVRAIGTSETSIEELQTINSVVPVSLIELEWSLFSRECEKEIVPFARQLGAGFLAYSPLGRGMLTGKLDMEKLDAGDFRRKNPRFSATAYENNKKLVDKVEELAAKKGCSSGQLALAWVLAQGDDVIPIPGTKRVKYLEENVGALNVKLSADEVAELRSIIPEDAVEGSRY